MYYKASMENSQNGAKEKETKKKKKNQEQISLTLTPTDITTHQSTKCLL